MTMRAATFVLIIGLSTTVTVAQTPNLSGTWTIDASRSDPTVFGESGDEVPSPVTQARQAATPIAAVRLADTLTIAQTGPTLTLQRSERSGTTAVTAVLDGVARPAAEGTVRGRAEGGAAILEVVKSVPLPGGGVAEARTTETFTRNGDGTLTVERTIESGDARRTWRFVYQAAR
jgi:hypothetical protein